MPFITSGFYTPGPRRNTGFSQRQNCVFANELKEAIDRGEPVTLEGELVKERFRNDSTGIACIVIRLTGNSSASGYIPVIGKVVPLSDGARVSATGKVVNDPKWGLQMPKALIEPVVANTRAGIVKFLVNEVPGLGEKKANRLYDAYGEDTLTVLATAPDRVAEEIRGISPALAENISRAAAIQTRTVNRDALLFCLNVGLSPNNAIDICDKYGSQYRTVITANPYCLIEDIHGIGFRKADAVAMSIGIPADSRFRIGAAIKEVLSENENPGSNVYLDKDALIFRTSALLSNGSVSSPVTNEKIADVLEELAREEDIVLEPDPVTGETRCYLRESYEVEKFIATRLMDISDAPLYRDYTSGVVSSRLNDLERILTSQGYPSLDDDQKEAVIRALSNNVSVITGGPGVGKTTILKYISEYVDRYVSDKVWLCAPTGKAAKRMSEQAGIRAYTIHRLFKTSGNEVPTPSIIGTKRSGVFIVDESSMLNERLMGSLLNHLGPGAKLILVGDKDQLPSIGAGQVLNDIINSECVPVSFLTKIHRQAEDSHVISCAHAINERGYVDLSSQFKDFAFCQANQSNSKESVRILYQAALSKGYTTEDIQVLSPWKSEDKSECSADALNAFLQPIVNPAAEDKAEFSMPDGKVFREGDKVIQSANDYEITCYDADDPEEPVENGVFNGETGTITEISDEDGCIYVNYGDRIAAYDFANLNDLKLAYAMSIHKSQGSEYKLIILPVTRGGGGDFYTRNMLYTAVTRASKTVILLGDAQYFRSMARNASASKRKTALDEKIRAEISRRIGPSDLNFTPNGL